MDIPTVSEVLTGVAAGTYSVQQAAVWIELHIGLAVDEACARDSFAGLAMQQLMADAKFCLEAKNKNLDCAEEIAKAAFNQADKMKAARSL